MDFSNTSGIRSPFSPRVRQSLASRRSIGLTSLKKNQSKYGVSSLAGQTGEVITKTASNTVEGYGLPLPVLVTEVLTFADPNTHVNAKLLPSGWCWVVCGRKLLVWQYRDITGSSLSHGATGVSCKELTLPQTDLAHKADLVCVFSTEESQVPSCIGVSPEGLVRYWPSIAHEGSYVDESADLQGQECDTLTDVTPVGCILATTTCTIMLVQPNIIGGRHGVVTRTLRAPSGWLGGLGRRVSLLFFGSMPAQMAETKLVGVTVLEQLVLPLDEGVDAGGPYITCMAVGPCLQLWRLPAPHSGAPERLVHELELRKPLREAFVEAQLFAQGDIGTLDVYVLDMQASGSGLLLLLGAVILPGPAQMRYALAQISVEEDPSSRVTSFVSLQYCAEYHGDGTQALALRMLVSASTTYLYTQRQLTIMSSTISNDKPDIIDFNSNGDKLLGGALCLGKPLFFSKNHGVIAVLSNDFSTNDTSICDSPIGSPCPADGYDGHLSIYEMDPHEMSAISYDISGKLKTAFLYHIRRDAVASRALIQQNFPPPPPPPSPLRPTTTIEIPSIDSEDDEPQIDVDAKLDRTVIKIGEELLDDVPAGDPRWNQPSSGTMTSIPLGSSGALQIAAHIRDKQRALSLFTDFLRASGLWSRLGAVSKEGGGAVSTVAVLRSMLERLATAGALRRLQQSSRAHAHIIDTAIQIVVDEEDTDDTNANNPSLSPSDVFYKKVSGVDRALHAIVCWCGQQATSDSAAQSLTTLLLNANQVLLGVIQDIVKCRQQRWELVMATREADTSAVTWTSDSGPQGLLSALMLQQEVTIQSGARAASEAWLRGQLYDQALALTEYVLGEARAQADARGRGPGALQACRAMYHDYRTQLIQPFIEDGQFDRAGILAEKFLDFEKLVLICQKANDIEKLFSYMDKYEKDGMVEYTFAWYVDHGLSSSLMRSFSRYEARLCAWLAATPERASLQWLHQLATDQWGDAARCLADLSHTETQYTQRMKSMASLGKLCALLASADAEAESLSERCDRRLQLAEHIQQLPRSILLSHGLEDEARKGKIHVITPADIVHMYVTSEDTTLTEFDYKKALEVTELAHDSERDLLRRNIWIATILHDDWREYDPNSPLDAVQEKIFFKLIEWSLVTGYDLEANLPSVEDILESPELAHIADDPGFQFILKYGYEHLYTQQTENMITDS